MLDRRAYLVEGGLSGSRRTLNPWAETLQVDPIQQSRMRWDAFSTGNGLSVHGRRSSLQRAEELGVVFVVPYRLSLGLPLKFGWGMLLNRRS